MQEAGLISTLPLDVGVTDVAFSPDNKWVAGACGDGSVHVWDIATGKQLAVCRGHKGAIFRVMFTPDGKQIVTGGQDGTARLWDATTGKLVRTFVGHENHVHGIAVDAASNAILTASCDGSFILWDMATGKSKVVKQTDGQNQSCAFAPDGKSFFIGTLAVRGAEGEIQSLTAAVHRYDAATQQETQTYKMDGNNVADIQISADMSTMVACSWDQCFFLDLASGKLIKSERIRFLNREDVKSALSKDLAHIYVNGNFLASFQKTGVSVGSKNIPPVTHGVALSPDDSMIAVPFGGRWGNDDNKPFTSQPVNGVLLFDRKQFDDAVTASSSVQNSRQIAPLGNDLAVLGNFDGKMNIWDFNKEKSILEFEGPREPMMLATSPDRRFVAVPEPHEHVITLLSLETGKQLQQLSGHKGPVTGLVFGDNVLYSASEDGHVIAWNAATGEKKFDTDLGQPARGLALAGADLLTAVQGQLVHLSTADGKDTREPLTAKAAAGEMPIQRVRNSQPGTLILLQFNLPSAAPVLAFFDAQ